MMDERDKEYLLARFRAYLEAAGATPEEAPVAGDGPDLFTLLAEVAGLKAEVKVESRQVKAALDQFRELFDLLRQAQQRLEDDLNRQQQREDMGRQAAEQDLLLELLDLRDRLQAGLNQGQGYSPGWLARRGGAETFVAGMSQGLGMNLRRLDEILHRRGVRPLQVLERAFDPQTMHAGEVTEDRARPAGQVVGELRKGFTHHDRLLRAAEVVVNKLKAEAS
jgi:molecular chaperone GrpE